MSWTDAQPFIKAVVTLFAIINPIYVIPILNSMTSDVSAAEQRMMFHVTALVGSATVIVVGVLGEFVLSNVFHVGLGSLMVACGVLLVVVCTKDMITDTPQPQPPAAGSVPSERRRRGLIARAVSPMASPILIGPGSIVTAIVVVNHDGLWMGLAEMLTTSLLVIVVMHWGQIITRMLGKIGSTIISRVLMIFLAAIGMEFIYRGILVWLPDLQHALK